MWHAPLSRPATPTRLTDCAPRCVAASPLGDAAGLARDIEAAYRTLWQTWCANDDAARMRQRYQSGDGEAATALAEAILARNPDHAGALHILGLVRLNAGDASSATTLLRRAAGVQTDAAILSDLGVPLRTQQCFSETEATYREALRLDPTSTHASGNLGNVLLAMHRPHEAEAEAELRHALDVAPNRPRLLHNLALALLAQNAVQNAEIMLRRALAIDPTLTDAHETLAILLARNGRPIESEAHHRAALANVSQRHRVLSNLATTLQVQGRHREAIDTCRQALAERPDYATAQSNLLFALNYASGFSPSEVFAEYRAWDRQHAAPAAPDKPEFALDRTCARRLRIGYVSANFRAHAVALFAEPLLAAHDRSGTEVVCYADVPAPDATTQRFHALADQWRNIAGLCDAAVADRIRQDEIDVLVDLTGHMAGSRLLVFARKPAPVQVTCLLGHGYSSGMSAMDVVLGDTVLTPPGCERYFSERIARLPRLPLAYAPPGNMPSVSDLPALANATITFGYFGRPDRLTDEVIAAWARILAAVPRSRLVLNSFPFREPGFRAFVAMRFIRHGIARTRLRMLATAPQPRTWAAYQAIDIALDPFPHNAGTTTIEALWQGIPVISLAGRPSVGRFGAMIMHAIGMYDWVTHDVDGYVARAVAMAGDLPGLEQARAELRPRVAASPLCDAADLARHVEAVYREAWDAWRQSC
jgi:protein O-GlcNAc transferase